MSTKIIWEETKNQKQIELTVALPAFNAKKIIWLALESLKNQIELDFGWELIVWEEGGASLEIVKSFCGQLPLCQKMKYRNVPKRLPLMYKWYGIARDADLNSKIYVMQAADDYSPKKRLKIHHEHFSENPECVFSTQEDGLFYNLSTDQTIIYHCPGRHINLNMAYLIEDFKKVPFCNQKAGIDTYIRRKMDGIRQGIVLHDHQIDPDNWKYGICTDGANTISIARNKYYDHITRPFESFQYGQEHLGYKSMEEYIPQNVIDFLEKYSNKEKQPLN